MTYPREVFAIRNEPVVSLNEDLQIDKSTLKITNGNLVIRYERIKFNFKEKNHLT